MDLKSANIRNIYQLCAETNDVKESQLRVNIPFYQRPFKWTENEISKLIYDFFENSKREENSFLWRLQK